LIGGALFGAMIILPLYFQIGRGETALSAGLLMAPQGLGAAIAMPAAGRLTDRIGGGRIVVASLAVMTLATIPFAFVGASTSYVLLAALLVVRGVGLGGAMMPSMAAAYAVLNGPEVPRATSALNVIQRVGGSLGTAILAVALQHEITSALPSSAGGPAAGGSLQHLPDQLRERLAAPLADAFANTFWWAVGMALIAMLPALWLMRATRRTPQAPQPEPEQTPAELVA
jgi:MFS family permease